MPLFEENPAQLSKSRLRSDLVAHNVALPPTASKKEVYVELHLKHIDQNKAADFSSDEEDDVQVVENKEGEPEDAEIPDPSDLTDDELKAALLKHGVKPGPIVASTRALYEKKLRKLLQCDGHGLMNGAEEDVLYSDSEEEEEGSEAVTEETVEESYQAQESSQRTHAPRNREPCPKRNLLNVLKSSEQSRSRCSQIPAGISRASSVDQRSGLGSGVPSTSQSAITNGCSSFTSQSFSITQMIESRRSLSSSTGTERELNGSNVQEHWSRSNRLDTSVVDKHTMKNQSLSLYYTPKASPYKKKLPLEPEKDEFKDLVPDTQTTPTGIYATRRRPIKGAAGRPIQYLYPDTPASPTTLQRREVERRLVPMWIQILVFLTVTVLLYLICVCVEDSSFSPFVALVDSLNQALDAEERHLLPAGTQDTPALSGQE